jgi:hypothetical protein
VTAAQRAAWDRARTRIARLEPFVAAAVVRSIALLVAALPESKLTRLLRDGAIDDVLTVLLAQAALDRATMPFRLALRDVLERAFRWNVPYLPSAGKVDGTIAVVFDHLNPRVIEAMRTLETRGGRGELPRDARARRSYGALASPPRSAVRSDARAVARRRREGAHCAADRRDDGGVSPTSHRGQRGDGEP